MMAVDPTRLPSEQLAQAAEGERGIAMLSPAALAAAALPEAGADWVKAIDDGWVANVLEK